jgi:hypothetical protein
MKVTKDLILEITRGGIMFYQNCIKDLKVEGNKCRNVLNPFYKDSKPSLSIYFNDEQWYFKDHGNPEYSGDVFQFASFYFNLDISENFPEILKRMNEIDYSKRDFKTSDTKTDKVVPKMTFKINTRNENLFKKHELEYFKQYGITKEILHKYEVIPIEGAIGINSMGKRYPINRKFINQILVAYQYQGGAKIYSPNPKRFWHVGSKPSNYLFGESQIQEFDKKIIIITGGEKDVLTISGLGYAAICLNSENSTTIPNDFLDSYLEMGYTFFVLYDSDNTGIRQSKFLSEKYGFREIMIPPKIIKGEGKDISDFVKLGLSKKTFDKLILDLLDNETSIVADRNLLCLNKKSEETELLPLDIFPQLPDFFIKCCNVVDDPQDKSLVLLSSITLLGSAFRKVVGKYNLDYVGTNLFLFIVAPASSGKGILKYTKQIGNGIHQYLKESINNASEKDKQVLQLFFIPANSSSSSILSQLSNNEGYGILWETEADTLADTLSKDWGNFSDSLRKAFHHEPISYQRKTNNEHIEIDSPNLGIVLSGTPNQVNSLINSSENGLFSRILFFDFKAKNEWDKKFHLKQQNFDLGRYFKSLSDGLLEFFKKLIELDEEIDFNFTLKQWEVFHQYFEAWFNNSLGLFGEDILASIKRLGLITFKIGMILSISRFMDKDELPKSIYCSDEDFETSLKIANCCKSHIISVFSRLSSRDVSSRLSNLQQVNYFESLPNSFNKSKSREIADLLNIKHKTAENYIDLYIEKKLLVRYAHGKYKRII